MNDKIFKKKDKPEELTLVKQLIEESKFDEAHQLIRSFEEKGGHTLHERVSCHLLKYELLLKQGLYEDLVKLAEQTYQESLGLGKNLLSVDILLIMAHALLWDKKYDKLQDIIKQGEELLKALPQELPADYKQREAYIDWIKGRYYMDFGDADRALKHLEHSLALREEFGTKQEITITLGALSNLFVFLKVDYDRAIKIIERGIALFSGDKWSMGQYFHSMAIIHKVKGELERSIKLSEQSLTNFNDINNKLMAARTLSNMGEVYRQRGELNRALECLEQALALTYEGGSQRDKTLILDQLIQILIYKGDLEQAQQYLHRYEQLNNQLKDKGLKLVYLLNKALILKKSSRTRKRAEAEEILKQILEDDDPQKTFELNLTALINLCELLFTELRMTNDLEVLEEIKPLIAQLLEVTEKTGSYSILCEIYLLQAKLSLLNFNIKKAQRLLTQAQQIAEKFGLNLLAKKIATENEDLLKKLNLWEKLKEAGAPMADRLELARLDEKIVRMIYNRVVLTPQVTEEKVAISKETKICLVCKGEVIGFSYSCKCGANYCENCARALTNLENMCWACDTPIDYSKPVKRFEEEERLKVSNMGKKK